jgi:hypothetical protein
MGGDRAGDIVITNSRHRRAATLGLMIILISSWAHASSFVIELQNGREMRTTHVWEEGDEIKLSAPGGTIGFPKALVKRIHTSSPISHETVTRRALPPGDRHTHGASADTPPQIDEPHETALRHEGRERASPQASTPEDGASLTAGEAQAYRAKKLRLTSALDAATNAYLVASGARNPDAKKAALDDMRGYSKQIIDLGEEVKPKNGGVLPAWWND